MTWRVLVLQADKPNELLQFDHLEDAAGEALEAVMRLGGKVTGPGLWQINAFNRDAGDEATVLLEREARPGVWACWDDLTMWEDGQ